MAQSFDGWNNFDGSGYAPKMNPFSQLGSAYQPPSWDGGGGGQQFSGAYAPPSWGGGQQGGGGGQQFSGAYAPPSWDGGGGGQQFSGAYAPPSWGGGQQGGGGQQFSGAYAAPSWGGGQQGPMQMPGGVRDRSTMFDPRNGGQGGFSMTKGAGIASNIGDIARRFKPMSKGGYSIGEMFKPGGMTNKLLGKGGKVGAAISGAPAWAMPAAGAAAFGVKHLIKRSKQKKHQKQQNAQRDQIKNAAANGQYMRGNPGNFSGPQNF